MGDLNPVQAVEEPVGSEDSRKNGATVDPRLGARRSIFQSNPLKPDDVGAPGGVPIRPREPPALPVPSGHSYVQWSPL